MKVGRTLQLQKSNVSRCVIIAVISISHKKEETQKRITESSVKEMKMLRDTMLP